MDRTTDTTRTNPWLVVPVAVAVVVLLITALWCTRPMQGQSVPRTCTATIPGLDVLRGQARAGLRGRPPDPAVYAWGVVKVGGTAPPSGEQITFELAPTTASDAEIVIYYRGGVYPCVLDVVTAPTKPPGPRALRFAPKAHGRKKKG